MVTLDEYLKTDFCHKISYYSLEKYPLKPEEALSLEYDCFFDESTIKEAFNKIHHTDWEKLENIYREFYLQKIEDDFFNLKNMELPPVDVVYFDCFGARVQPDLWEEPLVKMVAEKMAPGGLFTTYSSKGSLQRILKGLNFEVEKLEGPKGKREMINAWKK